MATDIILISLICVFVIDCTDIIPVVKRRISNLIYHRDINISIKPFDCSLCMSFWCGLAYLLLTGSFSLPLLFIVCLSSYFTPVYKEIYDFVTDMTQTLISNIRAMLFIR